LASRHPFSHRSVRPRLKFIGPGQEIRNAGLKVFRFSADLCYGMDLRTKAYIGLMIVAGMIGLGQGFHDWSCADPAKFLSYLILAGAASGVKIRIPGALGTISLNFIFMLLGVAEFSLGEALLLGTFCALVQSFFHAKKRPTAVQLAFNVSNIAFSIYACYLVEHASGFGGGIVTAATLFVVNTTPVAIIIALTEHKNPWVVWRESYFWTFPNYLVGAGAVWLVGELNHKLGWQAGSLLLPIFYVIHRSHRSYVERLEEARRSAEQQATHATEVAGLHRRTIETLALAVEAKDQTTRDHLERVETYAMELGRELGLGECDLEALSAAALLHDIGKLAVPEYIIAKPGKLTPEEFDRMKTHTVVGAAIVNRIRFPYGVAEMVRGHHERWNGTGYPDGLAGEEIPMGARILAAVDCLDALTSDRQYRRAMPLDKALEIVKGEAGKSFDPKVVEILVRRVHDLDEMTKNCGRIEKLPTAVRVERGEAPAAGFEKIADSEVRAEEMARDLEALSRKLRDTPQDDQALTRFMAFTAQCNTPETLLAALPGALPGMVPYDAMVIYRRRGDLLLPCCSGGDARALFGSGQVRAGEGLSGWVAEHGKAIVNGNPAVEPAYLQDPGRLGKLGSALAVPLITDSGIAGVLSLYRTGSDAFSGANLATLTALSPVVAHALEGVEFVPA